MLQLNIINTKENYMNCCDAAGTCQQDKDCPIRRRVRAGGPPPTEMPVNFAEGYEQPKLSIKSDVFDSIFVAAVMAVCLVIGFILGKVT
jgi:hypothetical protein